MVFGCLILVFALSALPLADGRRCPSPPPGINKMRRGVDVTTLDLLPLDLTTSNPDGFKRPIIDFTCNLNLTWTDRKKNTYDLPDQIWDILSVPGGWSHANEKIFKNYNEVKKTMAASAGISVGFKYGMFSASGSYTKMQHTLTRTSQYIEEVSAYDAALKIDFLPAFDLETSRYFKRFIDRLSTSFTSNPSSYFRFIRYFGTHYFTSGNFGGAIKLHIETKSSYYDGKTTRDVQAQAKASFLSLVKIRGSGSSSSSRIDRNFKKSSTESLKYFGGDVNLLSKGLSTWQPTVITNPWLFSGEIASLSDFVEDATKKKSFERAVSSYINKANLREIERLLIASALFSGVQSLLTRVRAELKKIEPTQSIVDQLGKEVALDFQVPSWFTDDLQLCFKWYADGDAGQCGGGVGRLLCAPPGRMTQVYRDDTDRRAGGCRMSWGLIPKSKTQPLWFHSVKLCYRWYADGDAGSCGYSRDTYCASFGTYTRIYRDDTDRRPGGCRMSWKLSVASTSPKWLKNAKLCYSWYADGDGGQCGGGVAQDLCAKANQWTTYYRDDTDRRPGGCRMSWGIKL
ncbi:perivitellin-2 67 kDa subunit-like [Haliotis cracherodii]|uniref:perivitellin-2 67 kDa subunit-like n=1 Tax=Haliotis cracherodii TaxID=6455 RepID=UPI0039E74842